MNFFYFANCNCKNPHDDWFLFKFFFFPAYIITKCSFMMNSFVQVVIVVFLMIIFVFANCDCKNAHFYSENSDCRNPPNAFNKNYLCCNIVLTTCIQNLETHVEWLWSNKRKGINRSKSNITMWEECKWKQTCIQGFEPNC